MLFFFNDTATTEIYTLSLHDALPISGVAHGQERPHVLVRCVRASSALDPVALPERRGRGLRGVRKGVRTRPDPGRPAVVEGRGRGRVERDSHPTRTNPCPVAVPRGRERDPGRVRVPDRGVRPRSDSPRDVRLLARTRDRTG